MSNIETGATVTRDSPIHERYITFPNVETYRFYTKYILAIYIIILFMLYTTCNITVQIKKMKSMCANATRCKNCKQAVARSQNFGGGHPTTKLTNKPTYTHTHTLSHTRTHTRARAHTHTHTHTYAIFYCVRTFMVLKDAFLT